MMCDFLQSLSSHNKRYVLIFMYTELLLYNMSSIESQIVVFIQRSTQQNLQITRYNVKLWHFIKLNSIDHKWL